MGATRGKTLAGIAALAVLPLLGVPPRSAAAAPEAETAVEQDPATRAARRHFQSGIKLYRDANYSGALAEFEAAYRPLAAGRLWPAAAGQIEKIDWRTHYLANSSTNICPN